MRLSLLVVCALTRVAFADTDAGDAGLQLGVGRELSGSRGLGIVAADTGGKHTVVVARLHADWRVARYFSVGFAVPALFNGVGPTSTEYHAGIALRGRVDYPVTEMVRPYLAIEQGLAVARLPQGVGWSGQTQHVGIGVRLAVTDALSISAEVMFERADFVGDSPESDLPGPLLHGEAHGEYVGAGLGIEARL